MRRVPFLISFTANYIMKKRDLKLIYFSFSVTNTRNLAVLFCAVTLNVPGPVARSDARPLGIQTDAGSIL